MGRIKTTLIKRTAEEFLEKYPKEFKGKFQLDKNKLKQLSKIQSKKLRNTIAGYIARLVKLSRV